MIIKSITMKNIRSYKDQKIIIPKGTVLLWGEIGAGKSTILMSIYYAMFGIQRGEISGAQLLRKDENYGFVELELEIGDKQIIIRRSMKRTDTIKQENPEIIINGVRESLTPTQLKAKIINLLGYPKDSLSKNIPIFNYTVYTPQGEMKSIMTNEEDRVKTLRKIFDVEKYEKIKNNTAIIFRELNNKAKQLESGAYDIEEKKNSLSDIIERIGKSRLLLEEYRGSFGDIVKKLDSENIQLEELQERKDKTESIRQEFRYKKSIIQKNGMQIGTIRSRIKNLEMEIENSQVIEIPEMNENIDEIKDKINEIVLKREEDVKNRAILFDKKKNIESVKSEKKCPLCYREIDSNHFDHSLDELIKEISLIEPSIVKSDKEINELKSKESEITKNTILIEKRNSIQSLMDNKIKEKDSFSVELKGLEDENHKMEKSLENVNIENDLEPLIKELKEKITEIQAERTRISSLISSTEKEVEILLDNKNTIEKEIEKKEKMLEERDNVRNISGWINGEFISMVSEMERSNMNRIHQEFNTSFQKWLNIFIDNIDSYLDNEFSPIIMQNGNEIDYSSLSGGEKSSIAFAYRLALNEFINKSIENIKTTDLMILDEPTEGFGRKNLDKLRDAIEALNIKQIIIVSHEESIRNYVDNVIVINKENYLSRI